MRIHFYFNFLFLLLLAFVHPAMEWPDAEFHYFENLNGNSWYPFDFLHIFSQYFLNFGNIDFKFFSDLYVYKYNDYFSSIILNFNKLLISTFILILLHFYSKNSKLLMVFNPPLVFSLFAPSQEVFSIFFIIMAFYFHEKKIICLIFLYASLKIDRSMIAMAPFILFYSFSFYFRNLMENRNIIFVFLLLFCLLFSFYFDATIFLFNFDQSWSFLSLTYEDVVYNSQYGKNKYFALLVSFFGLYGSMSIRPFPFFLYYPVISIIFFVSFLKADFFYKNLILFNISIIVILLWLIPPLSQARYFPLVSIAVWNIFFLLIKDKKYKLLFSFFVLFFTGIGLLFALIKNL